MNWLRKKVSSLRGPPIASIDEAAAHLTVAHDATESRCNELRREIQLCETRKAAHISHGNEDGLRSEFVKQKQLQQRLRKLEGVGANTRRQAASVQDAALYAKTIKAQRVSMQAQSEEYKHALNGEDIDKVMQEMEEWEEQEQDIAGALAGDVMSEMEAYDDDDELTAALAAARSNNESRQYHGMPPPPPETVHLPALPTEVPVQAPLPAQQPAMAKKASVPFAL